MREERGKRERDPWSCLLPLRLPNPTLWKQRDPAKRARISDDARSNPLLLSPCESNQRDRAARTSGPALLFRCEGVRGQEQVDLKVRARSREALPNTTRTRGRTAAALLPTRPARDRGPLLGLAVQTVPLLYSTPTARGNSKFSSGECGLASQPASDGCALCAFCLGNVHSYKTSMLEVILLC